MTLEAAEAPRAAGDVTHLRELGEGAVGQHGDMAKQLVDTVPGGGRVSNRFTTSLSQTES